MPSQVDFTASADMEGSCCNATDEIVKGLNKVGGAIGINIPGRSNMRCQRRASSKVRNTWTNNLGAVVNTKAALAKRPVDVVRRLAGDKSSGAQCRRAMEDRRDGIEKEMHRATAFLREWNDKLCRCLKRPPKRGATERNVSSSICDSGRGEGRGKCYVRERQASKSWPWKPVWGGHPFASAPGLQQTRAMQDPKDRQLRARCRTAANPLHK